MSTPRKSAKKSAKKSPDHPTYEEMIRTAIVALKERGGSSLQAIWKYVVAHNKGAALVHLKLALKRLAKSGKLVRVKASYKLGIINRN